MGECRLMQQASKQKGFTAAALAALLAGGAPAGPPPRPALSLPIACAPGRDCAVQQYMDHDPGPGTHDFRCGSKVYDGHDGTDFRLPDLAAQRRGVAVLAAADGTVKAARDGVTDRLAANGADRAAILGRECGNGVVLSHGDGWETQYCHMAESSVAVQPGEMVKAGAKLGLVGLSGNTQFPHLHLAVRHGATKVDPFAPDARPGACSATVDGPGLWRAEAFSALRYAATAVLNIGLADSAVDGSALEAGGLALPDPASPMVAYVRAINLRAGDRMRILLVGPGGAILAENRAVMDGNKAQYLLFAGKPAPASGWPAGLYRAQSWIEHADDPPLGTSAALILPRP